LALSTFGSALRPPLRDAQLTRTLSCSGYFLDWESRFDRATVESWLLTDVAVALKSACGPKLTFEATGSMRS
jgi:hypothetical protein